MIDKDNKLPVVKQCKLLNVGRTSVYQRPVPSSTEDLRLMRLMDAIHLKRPFIGSRRMVDELRDEGLLVNRKRVQRLMRLMGIEATYPKPRTSRAAKGHTLYPYLLRDVNIDKVHQVWSADITYLPMARGFCYLVAIMDVYSRKILSWRLANTMDTSFCLLALDEAIRNFGKPDIFNTDQGAQFTSDAFTSKLTQHDILISMDGKGRWIDNVFIERFWRSLKYEEVYLHGYDDLWLAKSSISSYMTYYNQKRRHSSLGRRTPDEVYNSGVIRRVARSSEIGYVPVHCA